MLGDDPGELFAWIFTQEQRNAIPSSSEDVRCLRFKEFNDILHGDVGDSSTGDDRTCACSNDEIETGFDPRLKSLLNFGEELCSIYPASAAAI